MLIPRPDTECLVELGCELARAAPAGPVLDLGTGSGALAVCLDEDRNLLRGFLTWIGVQPRVSAADLLITEQKLPGDPPEVDIDQEPRIPPVTTTQVLFDTATATRMESIANRMSLDSTTTRTANSGVASSLPA